MGMQAARALPPLPACAQPALRPALCQHSGPLATLPQFNEELGRQPQQSSDMGCISGLTYDMYF